MSMKHELIKFVKFLCVGAINTLFGYVIYALFLLIGLHYSLALLFGTIIAVIFNFNTTGRIVFNNTNNRLIFNFISIYIIIYLINLVFLTIFNYFNINLYIGGLFMLMPMAILGFKLNQMFVFNVRTDK